MKNGKIFAVGIGSGTEDGLTAQARNVIESANVIVGYKSYCDMIKPLLQNKRVLSSGMRDEVERCNNAIKEAIQGNNVAVISSGDAGIYGMAGLILEILDAKNITDLDFEVIPGVTAASEAAAAVGAPLMNDFAVISLSDLMTDREVIINRIKAVAESGMACVLYNPRSTKRKELFDTVLNVFQSVRGSYMPIGLVRNAGRKNEYTWVGKLSDISVEAVDMSTVVIMGSLNTIIRHGKLLTPRGYKLARTLHE